MQKTKAINKTLIKQIEREARKYFKGSSGCHDWTHVERVRQLALKIAGVERAEAKIVELAALLHDIARAEEIKHNGLICHATEGAKLARRILNKYKVGSQAIDEICQAILAHRHRNSHQPETLAAKILYDADRLDALGAVGVARDFLFAGQAGSKTLYTGREKKLARAKKDYSFSREDSAILEYEIKLKHLRHRMMTKSGKAMARERSRYMKQFFDRFWQEVQGEK